ncbi:hypothetical protein [Nibribacter koreensis]|uniref:Uncharacterized protein n=1 Tax=Nibribacter koreensis TaxID=1084519 RepID=A0ABP8FGG2_9BACT
MLSPRDFKELLTLFKVGLAVGLIEIDEVKKWADGIILSESDPDIFFIELSLVNSNNQAITLISENLRPESYPNGKAVLGQLHKRLAEGQELELIVRAMYSLLNEAKLSELEKDYIYSIDDYFDMANKKVYGNLQSVEQQTADFLFLYKEYTLENHLDWPELDKRADYELEEMNRAATERHEEEQRKPWWKKLL